ncbi:MAG: hypothetical protein Q4Q13_05935, partial [Vagococcus sp.]|nr:hypothetical protein [Vagococcus sp.]
PKKEAEQQAKEMIDRKKKKKICIKFSIPGFILWNLIVGAMCYYFGFNSAWLGRFMEAWMQ